MTFECTVTSRLGTIWRGSALDCGNTGNEIQLLKSIIGDRTCNGGMITGRVIRHEDDNYTSQLNVSLSSDLIEKIIECASDNGSHDMAISNTTLDNIITCTRACRYTSLPIYIIHSQLQFHFHHLTQFP